MTEDPTAVRWPVKQTDQTDQTDRDELERLVEAARRDPLSLVDYETFREVLAEAVERVVAEQLVREHFASHPLPPS